MSTLETNSIGKYSGNNVSIDDALNLKSYTTTQRDALTSVAGDVIYNTTDSKVQVYTGSAWEDLGGVAAFELQYVIVGGGGSGASIFGSGDMGGGGAGAGGYISSVDGENSGGGLSSQKPMYATPSTNYPISIGAGGAADSTGTPQQAGNQGTYTHFNNIIASGGGAAQSYGEPGHSGRTGVGGSGGGRGTYYNRPWASTTGVNGLEGQGYAGGNSNHRHINGDTNATGGGGGAGAAGSNADTSTNVGGDGGDGVQTSITGTPTYLAGGGGGSGASTPVGSGGQGGGADGTRNAAGNAGTANTGGGAGGLYNTTNVTTQRYGGNGGSGVIYLLYPDTYTISNTGMTITETDRGDGYKYAEVTAGTGTVSWS
jgi:hypothetical protein